MEKEIFKDIKGYEGIYQISNYGNVKRLQRELIYNMYNQYGCYGEKKYIFKEKILKLGKKTNGYLGVSLTKNGIKKNYLVHKLVALHFLEKNNDIIKNQINHKDENKKNNYYKNLEWCTAKYNINYGNSLKKRAEKQKKSKCQLNNKSTSKKVFCIETKKIYPSIKEASRQLNIDNSSISKVCRGIINKTNNYKFVYI